MAEIDFDGLDDVVAESSIVLFVDGGIRHDVFEASDGVFEILLGSVEVFDDNPSDLFSVVICIELKVPFLRPERWLLIVAKNSSTLVRNFIS